MFTGDPTKAIKLQFDSLTGSDAAVPNLWDSRFMPLLDNDAVLDRRIRAFEDGSRPVRSVQVVADLVSLRAFASPGPSEAAYIPFLGLYKFYPTSSEVESLPFVVRPDSNVGRWRLDMIPRSSMGQALGVATLDANGFVSQSIPNGTVTAEKLAAGAVTTDKLGNFTVDDSVTLNTDTATLLQIISALANRLRAASGGASWRSSPPVSLATLNSYAARVDNTQTWSQQQTMNLLTVTGTLIIPVL